jgi:flagellar biosynthesis GTPase FlhF
MDQLNNLWNQFEEFIKNNQKIVGIFLAFIAVTSAISWTFGGGSFTSVIVLLCIAYGLSHRDNPKDYRTFRRIIVGLFIVLGLTSWASWHFGFRAPFHYWYSDSRSERRMWKEEAREEAREARDERREERRLRREERKRQREDRESWRSERNRTRSDENTKQSSGQKEAVKEANSYLVASPVSRRELIKQLEAKKYSRADAEYAADNSGADWNEQARKKGKAYLDAKDFSRAALIEQLEFDGFSNEQARYAADKLGRS